MVEYLVAVLRVEVGIIDPELPVETLPNLIDGLLDQFGLANVVGKSCYGPVFELTLTCELTKGRKRRLTIKAGRSHQFVIPEDDLHR